jgi:hypothetical protein
MRNSKLLIPVLLGLAGAVGCAQDTTSPAVPQDLAPSMNAGAVHAVVEQGEPTADGKMRYTVRVIAKKGDIAAYQGVLAFTPGTVEIEDVTVPTTDNGEVHLVNREGAGEGRIRFAAYAPEALSSDQAFTIVTKANGRKLPDFVATLDVAGSPEGEAKPRDMLKASQGIRDKLGNMLR